MKIKSITKVENSTIYKFLDFDATVCDVVITYKPFFSKIYKTIIASCPRKAMYIKHIKHERLLSTTLDYVLFLNKDTGKELSEKNCKQITNFLLVNKN